MDSDYIFEPDKYKVECYDEVTRKLIYETNHFVFKINENKLEKLKEKGDFIKRISSLIQKGMKQKVDLVTSFMWEKSYKLILDKLTVGQQTI